MIPVFESRMGAMLFLISALLSRGLVCLAVCASVCFLQYETINMPLVLKVGFDSLAA